MGDFSSQCTRLQFLRFNNFDKLREVEVLGVVPNLKFVEVSRCEIPLQLHNVFMSNYESLQHLCLSWVRTQLDLRGMNALESLNLKFAVGGIVGNIHGLPKLVSLCMRGVKEIGFISQLRRLQTLEIERI